MVFSQIQRSGPSAGAHTLLGGLKPAISRGLLVGLLALFSSWFSVKGDDRPETKRKAAFYSILGTTVLFARFYIQLNGPAKLIALAFMRWPTFWRKGNRKSSPLAGWFSHYLPGGV